MMNQQISSMTTRAQDRLISLKRVSMRMNGQKVKEADKVTTTSLAYMSTIQKKEEKKAQLRRTYYQTNNWDSTRQMRTTYSKE